MFMMLQAYLNSIDVKRALAIGLLVSLVITGMIAMSWIQTEQVIAPPQLRVQSWLWKVFVCQCPV